MNDQIILLTFGITIGTFLVMFLAAARLITKKSKVFLCPNCQAKNSRERITSTEISCSECAWQLKQPQEVIQETDCLPDPQVKLEVVCCQCSSLLTEIQFIELWDNRLYCKTCVREHSSLLWDHATDHEIIQEEAPYSGWQIFRRYYLLFALSITALFGWVAVYAGWEAGGIRSAVIYFAWFQVILIPFIGVFTGAATAGFVMHRPEITVFNNKLTLRQGNTKSMTKPLADFEWFKGNASKTNLGPMFPSGEAILIVLPREKSKPEQYVAVGFEQSMREVWEAFLTLANVEHRVEWDRQVRSWSGVFNVVTIALLLPVTFASCFVISLGFREVILFLTGNDKLATLLGIQPFVPGTIHAMFYAILMLPGAGMTIGKTKSSDDERRKSQRKTFWSMFLMSLFILIMMLSYGPLNQLGVRILVFLITTPVWYLVSRDLARKFADRT